MTSTRINTVTSELSPLYEKNQMPKPQQVAIPDLRSRLNNLIEPETHLMNKSMKLPRPCFLTTNINKLTYNELEAFYKLKQTTDILVTPDSIEYDDYLRELWLILEGELMEDVVTEGWLRYGFQNKNPKSDFRKGGLISLLNLLDFSRDNQEVVHEMCEPEHEFLFAVSSINVTYFLLKYYHLADGLKFSRDKKDLCSRKTLKTFCGILEYDPGIISKIHSMLLVDLFQIWKNMKKGNNKITLLDFPKAMKILQKKYKKVTKNHYFDNFGSLERAYLEFKGSIRI